MKKLICSMMAAIVFLLSPLSAFASTSESMLMFSSTRSIPSSFYVPVRLCYLNEAGSFVYSNSINLVDDSESSVSIGYNLSGDVSDTLVGFSIDMSPYITSNSFDSISLRASQIDYWIYAQGYSFALSPFASPSLAYVEFTGTYDFQIYDGSVGYERWIYDNSFTISKPLSTQFSDFGLSYRKQNGSFSPDNILGFDMLLTADSLTVDDLLNAPSVRNRIGDYVEFAENNFTDGTFSSIEDFPTSKINIHPDRMVFYVLFSPIPQNFVSHTNPDIGYDFANVNNVSTTFRLATTYTNNGLTSVDVYGHEGKSYDKSVLSLISNSFSRLASSLGSGLSDVVTNATDNADRIIQNTTNKINEVKAGVTEVKDSVIETKNSILDLPNKIKDMLLGLIVPSSETMSNKFSEFSELLEEKLGIIYQVPMMLFDFFDTIVNAATTPQTTLTLPAFQLPWIDGSILTVWQPMEYRIIPEGMQVLSDLIKTITSMTVVVLTFNSVKRAYERFLRS